MPVQWMNEHSELRTMIEEGKDKLEWYRQVDPAKLNTLKELMMQDNYKENMSTLIKTLYEFAFMTYSGIFLKESLLQSLLTTIALRFLRSPPWPG